MTGQRVRRVRAHRGVVNVLDRTLAGGAGVELIATGSDDGTVKVWEGGEEGTKQAVASFEIGCPVTAVCWSADGTSVYIGALDNEIHVRFRFLVSPRPRFSCIFCFCSGVRFSETGASVYTSGTRRYSFFAVTLP
jgi:WD40 repeat protein